MRQLGKRALLRDAEDVFDERAGERTAEQSVGEGGRECAEAGEFVSVAKDIVMERMNAPLVLLREELGLVSGHVDGDRALGLASLATEAEVEGLVDSLALKAFGAQCSGEHFPEQARTASCGVLLVAGGPVTGAHDAAVGLEACTDADTAGGGALERALVAEENEMGFKVGVVMRTLAGLAGGVAQVLDGIINANRIGELAGIHAVVGIPDGLELAEGLDKLGAEHFGQKRSAGLAIAMLARERTAERKDEVGGAIEELAEFAQALVGVEVEVDAEMGAALPIVAVKRAVVAIFGHEGGETAEICTQFLGRNAGVVPAFVALGLAGDEDGGAEAGLADAPDAGSVGSVVGAGSRRFAPGFGGGDESIGAGLRFFGGPAAHFDEKEALAGGQESDVRNVEILAQHEADHHSVEAFEADRPELKDARNDIRGLEGVVECKRGEDAKWGRVGKVERRGKNRSACALGTHQGASNIEAIFRKKLVEVIAGDPPRDSRETLANAIRMLIAHSLEPRINSTDASTLRNEGLKLFFAGSTNRQPRPVVEQDIERLDVVHDFAGHEAVDAATVVADHAAEGAAAVSGWIGAVSQVVEFGGFTQAVEHNTGLDDREAGSGVK